MAQRNIDILVKGGGGQATASEINLVTAALIAQAEALERVAKASRNLPQMPGMAMGGAVGAANGGVLPTAPGAANVAAQQSAQVVAQQSQVITNGVHNATRAQGQAIDALNHKMKTAQDQAARLRAELQNLERVRNAPNGTAQYREALKIGGAANAPSVLAQALDDTSYGAMRSKVAGADYKVAAANAKIEDYHERSRLQKAQADYDNMTLNNRQAFARTRTQGEVVEQAHYRANAMSQRADDDNAALNNRQAFARTRTQGEVVEQAHLRANALSQRTDADNAALNHRLHNARVRPGEEMEAAQTRGLLETERRQLQAERQAQAAQNREISQGRRQNVDMMFGGMILSGAGAAMMAPDKYALEQYGQAQMTRVGLRALEGENAPQVEAQARETALDTYGASYRDVLGMQNQLRMQDVPLDMAQNLVKSLNDINAGLGGSKESMQRVTYNLEQVESMGVLTGREMRDFSRNRINLKPFIAQEMGIKTSEVQDKVSQGEVTADIVNRAIIRMGNDPRFKGRGAEISNNTLPGIQEKTLEKFSQGAEDFGEKIAPAAIKIMDLAGTAIDKLNGMPDWAKTAVAYGTGGAGILAGGAGAGMLGISGYNQVKQAFGFGAFGVSVTKFDLAVNKFAGASMLGGAGGGAAGLADDALDVAGGAGGIGGGAAGGAGRVGAGARAAGAWGKVKGFFGRNAFAIGDGAEAANAARSARIAATAAKAASAENALAAATKAAPQMTPEIQALVNSGKVKSVADAAKMAEAAKAASVVNAAERAAAARAASMAASQAPIAEAGLASRLGLAGKSVSVGGAALGVAGGAIGGVNNYYDAKRAGYSEAGALASGAFVGVAEAAIAMFVPGGAIAVALIEGFKGLANAELDEQDKQAAAGDGLTPEQKAQVQVANPNAQSSQEIAANEWAFIRDEKKKQIDEWQKKWGGGAVTERARDERRQLDSDYSQAIVAERALRRSAKSKATEQKAGTDEEDFKNWIESHGGTYIPPGGGTAAPQPVVRRKDGGASGDTVTLVLPRSGREKDWDAATRR